ncbi:MAG: hypothetical protein BWZ02_02420 [Lentisphaerae bacterium ADurb.BinA184]|nr:MAG: hypothetical protein BWZ02_02420 [Lentisphaerae bacterium ADurb.BinA184]
MTASPARSSSPARIRARPRATTAIEAWSGKRFRSRPAYRAPNRPSPTATSQMPNVLAATMPTRAPAASAPATTAPHRPMTTATRKIPSTSSTVAPDRIVMPSGESRRRRAASTRAEMPTEVTVATAPRNRHEGWRNPRDSPNRRGHNTAATTSPATNANRAPTSPTARPAPEWRRSMCTSVSNPVTKSSSTAATEQKPYSSIETGIPSCNGNSPAGKPGSASPPRTNGPISIPAANSPRTPGRRTASETMLPSLVATRISPSCTSSSTVREAGPASATGTAACAAQPLRAASDIAPPTTRVLRILALRW